MIKRLHSHIDWWLSTPYVRNVTEAIITAVDDVCPRNLKQYYADLLMLRHVEAIYGNR